LSPLIAQKRARITGDGNRARWLERSQILAGIATRQNAFATGEAWLKPRQADSPQRDLVNRDATFRFYADLAALDAKSTASKAKESTGTARWSLPAGH
jgi:hypothetical protein